MNSIRYYWSLFKHAAGSVLVIAIGIAVLVEILAVVYWGVDYIPYLFVCIAGLVLVTFFYGFKS